MRLELETECETLKHAEGDLCGDRLRLLDKYMDNSKVSEFDISVDADIDMLRRISSELLDSFEFDGEKKNPYVELMSSYLDFYYGIISKAGYVSIPPARSKDSAIPSVEFFSCILLHSAIILNCCFIKIIPIFIYYYNNRKIFNCQFSDRFCSKIVIRYHF